MNLKQHFQQQKQKMKVHLEQLRVTRNSIRATGQPTAKIDRQIAYEESRLAVFEDLWDVR